MVCAATLEEEQMTKLRRTTIGLRETTKTKLDSNRAPGQCYDGFLCQLVDLWEKNHGGESVAAGSAPRKVKVASA
jgi:hypothetical protein